MTVKISFIRGAYLNNFEGQNFPEEITGYSSLFPIDSHVPFPVVKLPSPADLQTVSFLNKPVKYFANRTLGDSQLLCGLEHDIIGSDIVHIADPHYYYSYQAAQLRERGLIKILVSTWWETIPFNNESTHAKKRIKQFTMKQVDHYICYCEKAKKCLIKEGVSENKITAISLGVDLSVFHPSVKKDNEALTILFVGRLVEEKGILDLYTAFKQLASDAKCVTLRIIGNGPLKNNLRNQIKKDSLQERVIIESKSYQEMPEVFRAADMLCVPSKKTDTWEEQLGMVFIEAMASGIPIISYSTGSIPEVVGNKGFLARENNVEQLAYLINKLVPRSFNEVGIMRARDLRVKLGTMGRERAEMFFDAKKTMNILGEFYKSLAT